MKKIKVLLWHGYQNFLSFLPDKAYVKHEFKKTMGKKLNLKKPITFNEKIQWLKLYNRKPEYSQMVDKFEVRKYIERAIGEEYLIPLIGVWDNVNDIDFDMLPNQFVLKPTHTSGDVIICKDKNEFDKNSAKNSMRKWLRRNYYKEHREWPYKNVKRRIICEKFMVDSESESSLKDYKIMCFNGIAKCLFICLNRGTANGLNVDFYDLNWNLLPFERHYRNSGSVCCKPKNAELMVKFAEKLAADVPFLRVDFYEIEGKLYFGELTFFPGNGTEEFNPESYDELLGSWINLNN